MLEVVRKSIAGQFDAALCMLDDCIRKCPPEHWDGLIAKYPFWQVAYHTLCFVDLYLSPSEDEFEPRADLHPGGWDEFNQEYPSRRFEPREFIDYLSICREKMHTTIEAETPESLDGASGQLHLPFSRLELRLYNIRHMHSHAGQLSAFLRRAGVDT